MGLDMSHGCWHGAYSAFYRFRALICVFCDLPPLELMEGFFVSGVNPCSDPFWEAQGPTAAGVKKRLPIKWDCLKPDPLHAFLYHSDCGGKIAWEDCGPIADRLEKIKSLADDRCASLEGGHLPSFVEALDKMIAGMRRAFEAQENIEFY